MPEVRSDTPDGDATPNPQSSTLFQVLVTGERRAEQVYTAMREIESMAGQTVVHQFTAQMQAMAAQQDARLDTSVRQLTALIQATAAEQDARLNSVEKQLGRMWTFLLLMFATLVGTLTTLLTTLLLSN